MDLAGTVLSCAAEAAAVVPSGRQIQYEQNGFPQLQAKARVTALPAPFFLVAAAAASAPNMTRAFFFHSVPRRPSSRHLRLHYESPGRRRRLCRMDAWKRTPKPIIVFCLS
jgi:hypothetical protein